MMAGKWNDLSDLEKKYMKRAFIFLHLNIAKNNLIIKQKRRTAGTGGRDAQVNAYRVSLQDYPCLAADFC